MSAPSPRRCHRRANRASGKQNRKPESALAPRRLHLVPPGQRAGLGGIVIGTANAGRPLQVGIALPDTRHHQHLLGPTGTGKTSLLLRTILQYARAGYGIAVLDASAKSDLVGDVLARLPADCGDRLVLIDPEETAAPPALNLLDPQVGGGTPFDAAARVASVMAQVWAPWWGHRTAEIAHHALLTLAHTPGATLAGLPRLLSDSRWRAGRVAAATRRLGTWEAASLSEFWQGFDGLPPGQRAGLVAPLLAKVRLVLAHPLAAALFGTPASTFTLSDVLDGGILLARLPKGLLGEDGCRLIGSLLLAALWQAAASRARVPEPQRLDAAIVIDECQNFLHLPIGVDDALAEARGLRTAFWLAHQYRGQLSKPMASAIDANCRNKVWFGLAPDDADQLARHVAPHLDAGDLARLGGFEAVLRPVASGRVIAPVTVDTLPPPPPVPGRADQLRETARHHTGLSTKARNQLLAEHLLAPASPTGRDHPANPQNTQGPASTAAAQLDDEDSDVDMTDLEVSESFPSSGASSRVGDSRKNSQMASCRDSAGGEFPPENPPISGAFTQVDDVEEEPWGGTDW